MQDSGGRGSSGRDESRLQNFGRYRLDFAAAGRSACSCSRPRCACSAPSCCAARDRIGELAPDRGRSGGARGPQARNRVRCRRRGARDRGCAGGERCRTRQEFRRTGAATGRCRLRRILPKRSRPPSRRRTRAAAKAGSFTRGLITGEPDDLVSLAGTALGDLFVFGDIRDALREGTRLATGAGGRPADPRPCRRRHCDHRGHLCLARRRLARRASACRW